MNVEVKQRTRTELKKPGESEFEFYDSSVRPEYDVYRDLVNGWIAELPESDGQEIIARSKRGNSLQYQAALAEVTVHAALKRQGYDMRLHPTCSRPPRRPDFEVAESGCGRQGDNLQSGRE